MSLIHVWLMATLKMLCEKLVIIAEMEGERAAHQSCYDINILVTEKGHSTETVCVCVYSELTQSGKEKFSQQQLTVKSTRETEKRSMLNTEPLVIFRKGIKKQVYPLRVESFYDSFFYCHSKFLLHKNEPIHFFRLPYGMPVRNFQY